MRKLAIALAALAAVLVVPASADPPERQVSVEQTRPNIIVIMTDDAREDDLTKGTAMASTRDIIATSAGNGSRYENFSSATPLCCPSRATFLTGQYPHNHGVLDNQPDNGQGGWLQFHHNGTEQTESLPIWLNQAGYRTQMFGKYLNGYGEPGDGTPETFIPNGWDFWVSFVNGVGYRTYDLNANGTIEHRDNGQYSTTDLADRAVFQLNQDLDSDVPIFQYLSVFAPHSSGRDANGMCSVFAEDKYVGDSNAGVPDSPAFNELDVSDKPAWIANLPRFNQSEQNSIANCRNERLDSMRSVDDAVVQIKNTLAAHGELSNTILIYVSDNGLMLGEHRSCCQKQWAYEESAGPGLAVRNAPGVGPGVKSRTVSNVDLAPSIVDWADAEAGVPAGFFDGQSLSEPNVAAGFSRVVLLEKLTNSQVHPPIYRGLRTAETWTLATYAAALDELYDGESQTHNKIGEAGYANEEAQLRAILGELDDCSGFETPASASTTDCNAEWPVPQ